MGCDSEAINYMYMCVKEGKEYTHALMQVVP